MATVVESPMDRAVKLSADEEARLLSIHTHMTVEERQLLAALCIEAPSEPVIVEVGSYLGASTCFLAAGARERNGRVHAVDTWDNRAMTEPMRDTYAEFTSHIAPWREWIQPWRGESVEIAEEFDGSIDLLFVDGDHSYEGVRVDLEAWLGKVKDGGIVVLHDYGWAEGVRRAARELLVPLQGEAGHRLDTIYWTRIDRCSAAKKGTAKAASVIIPTYGRPTHFRDALVSLMQQDWPAEAYEIVVVDNKPSDHLARVVDEMRSGDGPAIHYVPEPKVGLHNARHAGARAAAGDVLVYVDDDIIAHPGWLRAMVEAFEDADVGMVAGRVVPQWEGPRPTWLGQFRPGYLSLLDLGSERYELKWPRTAFGCNMAVRRSAVFEVGGFNPDAIGDRKLIWFRGDGETGLTRKVYDVGYKVMYDPHAWVYHRIGASRLEPRYFCRRSFLQGISESYTDIRQRRSRRGLIRLAGRGFVNAGRCFVRWLRRPGNKKVMADAWYWYARAKHSLRTVLSPKLYRHVLTESYL